MRANPKTAGALTIGGGSAQVEGGGGGSLRSQKHPHATRNIRKLRKNGWFTALNDFKNAENAVFFLKVLYLTKYIHETFFEEYINVKNFTLLKALSSYTCSKFWKSYTPSAARISVKESSLS